MTVGALPITMAPAGGGKSVATEFGWATPFSCATKTPRGGVATSGFNLSTFVGKSGMVDFGTNFGDVSGTAGNIIRSRIHISATDISHSAFGTSAIADNTWAAKAHTAPYFKATQLSATGAGAKVGTLNTVISTATTTIMYCVGGSSMATLSGWGLRIDLYSDAGGTSLVGTGIFNLSAEVA